MGIEEKEKQMSRKSKSQGWCVCVFGQDRMCVDVGKRRGRPKGRQGIVTRWQDGKDRLPP